MIRSTHCVAFVVRVVACYDSGDDGFHLYKNIAFLTKSSPVNKAIALPH